METTIKIQLDCSERLEAVINNLADGLRHMSIPVPVVDETPNLVKTFAEKLGAEVVKEKPENAKTETPEPATTTATPTPKTNVITDTDMRQAMADCRERLMGSTPDPILRKAINERLREKVSAMGFENSMQMPQELRPEFIGFCKTLTMPTVNESE